MERELESRKSIQERHSLPPNTSGPRSNYSIMINFPRPSVLGLGDGISILNHRASLAPVINNRLNQMNSIEELPPLPQKLPLVQTKSQVLETQACFFCGQDYPVEYYSIHLDMCEMRKVYCDRCNQRVMMDLFDAHYDGCRPRARGSQRNNDMELENDDDDDDDNQGDFDEHSDQDEGLREEGMFLPPSMTYEELLRLDEAKVNVGMTPDQMKPFPVGVYVKSLDGPDSCRICLYDYATGDSVRKLGCKHKFHKECVDKWLDSNISCPICKKYLR